MAGIDNLLSASVDAVKRSGALENNALMATVSVINSDGTVDCTRTGDTYPSVRLLSSYLTPTVGDSVELLRTAGGWICVGALRTHSAPRMLSGTVSVSFTAATSTSVTVTFTRPFASTPNVVASIASGSGSARWFTARAINATTTGFTLFVLTSDAAAPAVDWVSLPVAWIAATN
jgi:hypothetical protein